MAKVKKYRPRKRPLAEEIADTEGKNPHEVVGLSLRILRSLYLHVLVAMRDGDYQSPSAYISDLIRRDKHVQNMKPPPLEYPPHHHSPPAVVVESQPPRQPADQPPRKLGFEEKIFRPE